jgi:ABC-2 type transport system ATP-binding protein
VVTAVLEAAGLVKRFGAAVALDGFDLRVSAGEIAGLVGHNGAGKTTFARVTAGLVTPESGVVRVSGLDVARSAARIRPLLGLAPQELALYPTATARENLFVFAGLYGMRRREARHRIAALAESLMLADVLDRRVRDLSGGQQRRLQAATAMIHCPRLLLLDEPTVGADPVARDALLAVVRAAAADGAAVVYTTHYLPELDALDATLAVADHGRVIARGDRAELLATVPGHAVVDFDRPQALPAPPDSLAEVCRDGRRLVITAPDPAAVLVPLLAAHPDAVAHLRAIELRPPTLDDLYRHLVSA